MLIGLCGPKFAGKSEVARFLVKEHGFQYVDNPDLLQPDCEKENKLGDDILPTPSPTLVSQCWRSNINVVIRDIGQDKKTIDALAGRPYFLMIYVDAMVGARYDRFLGLRSRKDAALSSFVEFVATTEYRRHSSKPGDFEFETDDANGHNANENSRGAHGDDESGGAATIKVSIVDRLFSIPKECEGKEEDEIYPLRKLEEKNHLCIQNDYLSLHDLHRYLKTEKFDGNLQQKYLRPSWDSYFMNIASLASQRSNCMKRRVGCVIAKDRRIVSSGYNGTPSGVTNCFEGGCTRCNNHQGRGTDLDLCLCLHAEENAIIEAGRERCGSATLYSTLFPCMLCAKKIVQAGISRVVFQSNYSAKDNASEALMKSTSIIVDQC